MFDGVTRKEWERWERADCSYRAHPWFYKFKLSLLFAEGVAVGLLLFAAIAALVALCFVKRGSFAVKIGCFLGVNLVVSAKDYYLKLFSQAWVGLPELRAEDWPRLHELVGEMAEAVGAPRIHRIFLNPALFNASVTASHPLVPMLRRNILVLGYPLLAVLGERGLRGTLAHELGHIAHNDTVQSGALRHVYVFWESIQLGVFTWLLNRWRRWYLGRIDRMMSPLRRADELAADRTVAKLWGRDVLRESLVTLVLRGADSDLEGMLRPVALREPGAPSSPAEAIRAAMRRKIPADEVRRRIERSLRSIDPPVEVHPRFSVRTGTYCADDLLPFASAPADALERVFGSDSALDREVDELLQPTVDEMAESIREMRERNEKFLDTLREGAEATPDEIIDRATVLKALGRKEEALAVIRDGRAAYPGNAALETIELCDRLSRASSIKEGAPIADRLEQLVEQDPMMRFWAEEPLFVHFLEIGLPERIKNLLDLRKLGNKAVYRRLNAALTPKDKIVAYAMTDAERAELQQALSEHHRAVKEVYAVRRLYEGTGTSTYYLVLRLRRFAFYEPREVQARIAAMTNGFAVIPGTRALFRRFAELGVEPIPVSKKPKEQRLGQHAKLS